MNPVVEVILSTYNGAENVSAQIDSILNQTYKTWRLIIRDDRSSDQTPDLIKQYGKKNPEKIFIEINDGCRAGASAGFGKLLDQSSSDYVMFCDQDDIWLPDKIEITLKEMLTVETRVGKDTPVLVHTDLKVADKNLNIISDSFWRYQNICPEYREKLHHLLNQNVVTGCTVMINRRLRNLACPIPQGAMMHDWWIALVAAAFGNISHIAQPTVLYRQHGNNAVGAKHWGLPFLIERAIDSDGNVRISLLRAQAQARAFVERFAGRLSPEQAQLVRCYGQLSTYPYLLRLCYIFRYRFFKIGFLRNIGLILKI